MDMQEHVARCLCYAAASENVRHCPECDLNNGQCTMWQSFKSEADVAIEAVRDYARLDMRRKPRQAA